MDWVYEWAPVWYPAWYIEIEPVAPPADSGILPAWIILAVLGLFALVATAAWYRQRVARHSFWCATARRDVEARFRRGYILSCSAFEDPTAIACARRCLDRTVRAQWAVALPVLARVPRATGLR